MMRVLLCFLLVFCIGIARAQDPVEVNDIVKESGTKDVDIFTIVEKMPAYPGGERAMLAFLSENIRYPAKARLNNVQGTVVVQFIVLEDGKLDQPAVVRSIGSGCDEEVVRVVNEMPLWEPGMQDGVPIKVRYTLPVRFKLEETKKKKRFWLF